MRLLLDTHALLWAVDEVDRLSETATQLLSDADNALLLSPSSYWEVAIKVSLGKYRLSETLGTYFSEAIRLHGLDLLPIGLRHADTVAGLPHHHKDPFDRMLVAQAMVEKIPIVSRDKALDAYQVTRLW